MPMDMILRVAIGLVFVAVVWMVSRYRQGAQAGETYNLDQEGWAVAVPLRLAGLALWLYLPFYVLFPRLIAWSTLPVPAGLRWAALAVAALGVPPFVYWAQQSLGKNVTTTVITKKNHQLVTGGPYRYIRHPLYTAGLAFFVAMSVAAGSWFLLLAILTTFALLLVRTPKEEAKLLERFGDDYREYMKRTGRYIPRLWNRS
jgi:protein-S-isoprenylcysteine O-methyltransferase Ste14